MGSPAANPKILYRNSRLLRMVFLQLHRQQRADLFCDVVLQAEGEAVPAHCCILTACSPFFTERLEREMPPKGHKVVLELRGLKIGPLRKLVDFLYTSEMEVSREEAQDVLEAARQLQVSELESLQLEGGKLVKKAPGQRLNRQCLQLSSPVSISEGSLMQSPPASDVCCLISHHLLARKQQAAGQLPCTKGTGSNSNTNQKKTVKEKPAMKSEDKHQMPTDASATTELLTAKVQTRLAGTVKNIMGNEETGSQHTEQARPRVKQAVAGLQESKKIKLSRPKLSSSPLPMPGTTEDHSVVVSNKTSKSLRRLWRKKSPPVEDDAKGAEVLSHLHGFLSPSLLPKATKGRKRSSSEPAPSVNPLQEAAQVGRVKLRKVINGGCWEVVQEPSAAQPKRAADSVCALTEEGSLPQPRYTEQEVAATQQPASSTTLLPAKAESSSLSEKPPVGEAATSAVTLADRDSYQLPALDQSAEGEQYHNLAAAGESQDTTVPEGVPTSGPAPKTSIPLGRAGAEEKHWCPAEVSLCPQWIKEEKSSLEGEEGCAPGLTNGVPFLDPVHSCRPLATSESSNDCIPQPESLTAHHQLPVLENGATRLAAPLPSHENQGLPSYGEATPGAEATPAQVLLRSPLQHHLDCKLPPQLVILEEDEIDVGGVEFFLNNEYVWPDSSPVSENEVDVVS
ncbi:PREDICTED: BTB/POZ domain-containing protein 18 [Gekko japonicus]|uniref:BTB/POZ domain-containing protein 18 n=1 Tax=Gekko japonicus TaxID=146911 RepID=A0ABM1JU71_GEKJA|nr:PREDICTED: BTB/POZ domain-containing protein 18 [Gekko japonicus]